MTDVGQGDAEKIYNAAKGGTIRLDPGVAQECANKCAELAETFSNQIEAANALTFTTGFGGLGSSREL